MDVSNGEELFAFLQESQSSMQQTLPSQNSMQTPPRAPPLVVSAELTIKASQLDSPASQTNSTRTPASSQPSGNEAISTTSGNVVTPKKLSFMGRATALSKLASASTCSLDSQKTPNKEDLDHLTMDVSLAKKELDGQIAKEKKKQSKNGDPEKARVQVHHFQIGTALHIV